MPDAAKAALEGELELAELLSRPDEELAAAVDRFTVVQDELDRAGAYAGWLRMTITTPLPEAVAVVDGPQRDVTVLDAWACSLPCLTKLVEHTEREIYASQSRQAPARASRKVRRAQERHSGAPGRSGAELRGFSMNPARGLVDRSGAPLAPPQDPLAN